MSPPRLDPDRLAPRVVPGVRLLPVLHDRLDMAAVVRAVLERLEPAAVAVELPTTLAGATLSAVRRLPRISIVVSTEGEEDPLVWAVAPGDPFAEALRWALEWERETLFVDPDLPYGEHHADPVPDPHALWEIGPERYLELLSEALSRGTAGEADRRREAGMAYHLKRGRERLGEGEEILALVGAAHAGRLGAALERPAATPFARTRREHVEVRHLHPESLTALLPDPPLGHAVFELARGALPPAPPLEATLSRKLSLLEGGLTLVHRPEEEWGSARRHRVAEHAAHHCLAPQPLVHADRRRLGEVIWTVGARSWQAQTDETPAPWQRRIFFDFAHRYTRLEGMLVPNLYEWVVAARGVGDDNLAWEVFEVARTYPWQEVSSDLPTARIDGSELDLGTRRVRFRRRFFRVKERPRPVPVARRAQPQDPAEWLEGFDGGSLCSFPPEDLLVEDYGRFLRRKAASVLAAERQRSEPFTTSLRDGIDLRETLRRVDDGRIWVRESGRAPGRAGSVVVLFDRDAENRRFPYLMTWLGEHQEESDMAFYATHPGEQVVGPGILRATYGGFVMTVPPGRLFDVWRDPDYRGAREKAEVLVMAAVDYSREKLVAHVARKPPSGAMRRYAAARGKRLVHIPLGSLSPTTLRKIRVLHILIGHDKREIAGDYIW